MKFGRVVFELHERTDRQTDILITILRTPPSGEVTTSCSSNGIAAEYGYSIVFASWRRVTVASCYYFAAGSGAKYCDEYVCLSVCPLT